MLKRKFVALRKEAEDKNNIVDVLEDKIMNLNQRINVKEKEQSKCCVPKAAWETKIKEIRKNHMEEVHELLLIWANVSGTNVVVTVVICCICSQDSLFKV